MDRLKAMNEIIKSPEGFTNPEQEWEIDDILEKHKPREDDGHSYYWHFDAAMAMIEYSNHNLTEYKRRLKEEIVNYIDVVHDPKTDHFYLKSVLHLIDSIDLNKK
jgi:alpha/beta superfamily hydrolase